MEQDTLKKIFSTLDTALEEVKKSKPTATNAGIIKSVKDSVVEIENAVNFKMGEVVKIDEAGVSALILEVSKDAAMGVVLQNSKDIRSGQPVVSTGQTLTVPVSEEILGRVIDPMGRPLDQKPGYKSKMNMPLEAQAPDVMMRESVNQPVQTGILAIDALIPIGRGQRELIIGDRQTGKTAIAVDTILNQKGQDMVCVYVSIGQRDAKTAQVVKTLQDALAMEYTVVVSAGASESALLQFLAPYAGCAVAEYFMKQGKDVLVVYDDLSKHAVSYREVSLLLRKPPGREAYPGDVFYIHSRLLERAAKLNKENGGGSITALPIIETQAGDVSAYIPTNVISITDGQIFLEPSLFYRGIRPALNVGISVSRVGSAAQTKIMKKISGSAKLDLAQYYELAAFSQFASELDDNSKKQLIRGERLVEAMKQKQGRPRVLWQEVVILWAAQKGFLDKVPLPDVVQKLEVLVETVSAKHKDLVKTITDKRELSDDVSAKLDAIMKQFFHKMDK